MTIGILTTFESKYILGSIMPGYKWLFDNKPMDVSLTQKKMQVMTLGVLTQKVKLQVV
jgi:cbb3-type cytochrome oxidase cytochrome c subunit